MRQYYGPRFHQLHCRVQQRITNALAEMELTGQQGRVIGYISRCSQPPCPHDIEEVFRLSHPTVSGLLGRLEKKGFLRLEPDPDDKRCKRIFLLPKGEACSKLIEQTITATEAQIIHGFTAEEQAQFTLLLDRAIANIKKEE